MREDPFRYSKGERQDADAVLPEYGHETLYHVLISPGPASRDGLLSHTATLGYRSRMISEIHGRLLVAGRNGIGIRGFFHPYTASHIFSFLSGPGGALSPAREHSGEKADNRNSTRRRDILLRRNRSAGEPAVNIFLKITSDKSGNRGGPGRLRPATNPFRINSYAKRRDGRCCSRRAHCDTAHPASRFSWRRCRAGSAAARHRPLQPWRLCSWSCCR